VVTNAGRREQVHATYERIVSKAEDFAAWRQESMSELARISQATELDEGAVAARVDALKSKQRQEFQDYVDLQLKLRSLTTKKEFTQLGKFD
jgi:hypothetical protein